jgi:hypothetical protein
MLIFTIITCFSQVVRCVHDLGHKASNCPLHKHQNEAKRLLWNIAHKRLVLPSSIVITDVQPLSDGEVCRGGYANVQRGRYQGRLVAIKTLHSKEEKNFGVRLPVPVAIHYTKFEQNCLLASL